jgi:hypothetical protein
MGAIASMRHAPALSLSQALGSSTAVFETFEWQRILLVEHEPSQPAASATLPSNETSSSSYHQQASWTPIFCLQTKVPLGTEPAGSVS